MIININNVINFKLCLRIKIRNQVLFQYTLDQGRQRSYKLVAKKFEGMIDATDQLEAEKSKMQELKVN